MQFITIIAAIAIIVLSICSIWYNSTTQKGKRGEKRVATILSQLPEEYIILNDLIIQTEKGTTQIDHTIVSKYGVFVIETKNYRGEIYGDDSRKKWTQIIATNVTYAKRWWQTYTYITKNQFYNPVKQSFGHVYKIKELLSAYPLLKVIPIVVFTGGAVLKNVISRQHVIYLGNLLSVINTYKTTCLTDNEVANILNILEKSNIRKKVSNRQHVRNLRTAANEVCNTIRSGICPRCGGNLVKRNGKYGAFYGCSNYPKCNYIVK